MVPDPTARAPRGRILIADDEPHIRRILVTILEDAAYEVREVVDGAEALDVVNSDETVDFFLLDLMMPKATGLEVLDGIRAHDVHATTPVIMLTAKGQDTDRQEALARGANDFLTKPFSPKKLLARIDDILHEH